MVKQSQFIRGCDWSRQDASLPGEKENNLVAVINGSAAEWVKDRGRNGGREGKREITRAGGNKKNNIRPAGWENIPVLIFSVHMHLSHAQFLAPTLYLFAFFLLLLLNLVSGKKQITG